MTPDRIRVILSSLQQFTYAPLESGVRCQADEMELGKVLVFIDESGDPGFKLTRGSSSHFVVGMVRFDDNRDAENASASIAKLRTRLGVKPEFKFNKSNNAVRDAFFEASAAYRFRVRALVVDKSIVYSDNLRTCTDLFYNYFVRILLDHDNERLRNAKVKIDGSSDREFKRELNAYLRRELAAGKIADVGFKDSRENDLVQLADMVVGAIHRAECKETRTHCDRWIKALYRAQQIENIWRFR